MDKQVHRPRRRRAQQGFRRQSKPDLVLIQQKSCADTLRLGSHAELGWWYGPPHCPGPDTLERELDLLADVVDAVPDVDTVPDDARTVVEQASGSARGRPRSPSRRRARQGIPPESDKEKRGEHITAERLGVEILAMGAGFTWPSERIEEDHSGAGLLGALPRGYGLGALRHRHPR